jgi:DnaJ-class molecular chaperone
MMLRKQCSRRFCAIELEHEFFETRGENLHYDLYISFSEAVLRYFKKMQALNGKVRIIEGRVAQ